MRFSTLLGLSIVLGYAGLGLMKGDWRHMLLGVLTLLFATWLFDRTVIRRRF